MRSFPENFERLGFWEAHFGAPTIFGQTMTVPVKNLPFQNKHPLALTKDKAIFQHPALGGVVNGLLVFREVFLSRRKMIDYIGNPMSSDCKFSEEYEVVDIDNGENYADYNLYSFEGRIDDPPAGVIWRIAARSFELQVE
jgi:hypothetical protein